ncbi:MAG TPA: glycosyltransferase [Blastocatellia bacterium]|nr:glycosyltransferase [Blastocatellia bacterium]
MEHESTEARRVLFISYSFPPNMEMGAYTCAQIARYLPLYGWEPVVLTVKEKYVADSPLNHNGADRASGSDLVIRTNKLPHVSDIYRRFKSKIGNLPIADCGLRIADFLKLNRQSEIAKRGERNCRISSIRNPQSAFRNLRGLLLSFSSLPDKYNGWLIPAVAAGLRAVRQTRVKLIYSSAPYFTSHLAGYWLALLTGLPWVAHFRDPWVTGLREEYRPGNKICFGINRALERMTVSRADAVVCVTEEHAALMRAAYDQMAASKFAVVMNGFDGLEWQEAIESLHTAERYAAGAPRKFRVTYAGNLYMKRNPSPLFRALRTLIDCGEIARDEVSVELIGSCESSEGRGMADLVSEAGIEGCVEMRGMLSHSETLRRLLQSDLLLLLAEELVVQIPGKTFEYLKTRRPILALACEGAVASLLRRTGGAWVVNPNDQPGVINAVRECYRLWKWGQPGPAPDPRIVESFDRRRTTARIADLLDFLAS